MVALAKAAGFEIYAKELRRAQAEISAEISEEELGGVTGGLLAYNIGRIY